MSHKPEPNVNSYHLSVSHLICTDFAGYITVMEHENHWTYSPMKTAALQTFNFLFSMTVNSTFQSTEVK